jgi:hypothetical protein
MVTSLSTTSAVIGQSATWLNTPMPMASGSGHWQWITLWAITYEPIFTARIASGAAECGDTEHVAYGVCSSVDIVVGDQDPSGDIFPDALVESRRSRRHVASADSDSRKLDISQKYVSVDAARSDHQAAHRIADFAGLTKCTF